VIASLALSACASNAPPTATDTDAPPMILPARVPDAVPAITPMSWQASATWQAMPELVKRDTATTCAKSRRSFDDCMASNLRSYQSMREGKWERWEIREGQPPRYIGPVQREPMEIGR
jgi:hypothetical protein